MASTLAAIPATPVNYLHSSIDAAPRSTKASSKPTGRFHQINNFADFTLATLDRAQIAVWLLLWRDTKPEGLARTSQTDLARRAGVSARTVERAVKSLAAAGLLTVVYRGGLRKGPSKYRVHALPKEPPPDTRVGL